MRVVLFCSFFLLVNCYTVFDNGQQVSFGDTKLRSEWWGNRDFPNVWGRNYTTMAIPAATQCSTTAVMTGKLVFASVFAQPCDFDTVYERYSANGAAIISSFVVNAEQIMMYRQGFIQNYRRASIMWITGVPAGYSAYQTPASPIVNPGQRNADKEPGLWAYVRTLQNRNITVNVDYPTENTLWTAWVTVGSSLQMSFVVTLIAALILMIISSAKFYAFANFSGIRFSLPIIVTSVAFFASWIGIFHSMNGFESWRAPAMSNLEVGMFFQYFLIGFGLTLCTLMGLYFKEVSTLTSAKEIAGLGSVSMIAGISLGLMWIIAMIAIPAVFAGDPDSFITGASAGNEISKYSNIILAFIVVSCATTLVLFCWGALSLVLGLSGSNKKSSIIIIVATSGVACALQVGSGIAAVVIESARTNYYNLSLIEYIVTEEMLFYFCPLMVMHLILFNFKISLTKEIEISKSATSSTSSTSSSSKSSSSSSSSSNDPVIEL